MIQRSIPNPYQHLFRILIISAFLINIPAVTMMMSGNRTLTMLFGLFQFMMFFGGVALLIYGKKEVRDIIQFLRGEMLAHWEFDAFYWKQYSTAEQIRLRKYSLLLMVFFLIAGPAAALIGLAGMKLNDGIILGTVLGAASFGIFTFYIRSLVKRSERPPFEAFIGVSGAFINGVFIPWGSAGVPLEGISIDKNTDSGIRSIRISYSVRSWIGKLKKEIFVPIPKGKENEAKTIVSTISSAVLHDHH